MNDNEGNTGDSFGISRGHGGNGTDIRRHSNSDATRVEFCIGSPEHSGQDKRQVTGFICLRTG